MSKGLLKKLNKKDRISKPFAVKIIKQATLIAHSYRIIIEEDEALGFVGTSIEMPLVFADGKTPTTCVNALREALIAAIATTLEMGKTPPLPASEEKRTEQVNIRLSKMEKLRVEDAAKKRGFRGVSDFVRSAALEEVKCA